MKISGKLIDIDVHARINCEGCKEINLTIEPVQCIECYSFDDALRLLEQCVSQVKAAREIYRYGMVIDQRNTNIFLDPAILLAEEDGE